MTPENSLRYHSGECNLKKNADLKFTGIFSADFLEVGLLLTTKCENRDDTCNCYAIVSDSWFRDLVLHINTPLCISFVFSVDSKHKIDPCEETSCIILFYE